MTETETLIETTATEAPDTSTHTPPESNTQELAGWFYDEGLPGTGERPQWLKEKYKTAADQAKAYGDLEKKLGAYKGAPEEYDLEINDEELKDIVVDKNNPVLQDFLAKSKEQGVSQEFVTDILKSYAKMQQISQPSLDKEMEKLGINAKQDLQLLNQWGSNVFSKEEMNTFKNMVRTADSVRLFEKIRRLTTKAETQPSNTSKPYESVDKIKSMISDPRYDTDETFRKEVRAKLANALGE